MPLGNRIDNQAKGEAKIVRAEQEHPLEQERPADKRESMFIIEDPKYHFSDMILNSDTYDAIQDILTLYQKRELIFETWGLSATHKQSRQVGINLYGPSGTGKTMAAHAIAHQLGKQLLQIDYSQIESKYVGETAKNLTAAFRYAKENDVVLFFDEADALLSKRVTNMSNSTDVSVNQTRSVLLMLINDYTGLILFATNFIANYDPAFMRRMLAHVKFDYPGEENRQKLWKLYIPESLPTDADILILSEKYQDITGSDISNAVLAAALRAARNNDPVIKHAYFEEAIERIIQSKAENQGISYTKRVVDEDYVKSQFGGELPK